MRRVAKQQPPAGANRRTWQQARIDLEEDLDKRPTGPARTARARQFFDDVVVKEVAREELAREQARLCAFCESVVRPDARGTQEAIRIAHWVPIDSDPYEAVSWRNLFGSCSQPKSCDSAQGNQFVDLPTPADEDWSSRLRFLENGEVKAEVHAPPELRNAIDAVWGLNSNALVAARKAAVQAEIKTLRKERDRLRTTKASIRDARLEQLRSNVQSFQSARVQVLTRL